ncbi:hypothetical protein BRC71_08405 [Halobacteriales archaeon QH_7_65_31]|nr:MAG: hypothetical protein BRC71_08405 [Halobacteriales archaeon QH_7_65_31]
MDEIEYRGEWWIPDENTDEWVPEEDAKRTAGVLEFNSNDGGDLDLLGTLTDIGDPPREVDTIHGIASNGEFITLRNCFVGQSGLSIKGTTMRNQQVHVGQVFSNGLYKNGEPEFQQLRVTYPLLEMWSRLESVVAKIPPEYDTFAAELHEVDPITAQLNEAEIKVSVKNESKNHNWQGVELSQTAQITITPEAELPFSEYLNEYVRHIQHFLSLALGEPLNPDTVTGINPSDEEGKEKHKTDIAYQVSHLHDVPDRKHPSKVLFSLSDIDFEEAIRQWFDSARNAQSLHNLYFGTVYNEDMFEENRFLSLAIAIEGFQSYLFPDHRLMPKDPYDELHSNIMDTIPDDSSVRDRIDGLLNSIGHQPSLRDQITMVFDEYDDILPELIDEDDVISRTVKNRHRLAHALEGEFDTAALGRLARTLQVVIEAFLMHEIGLESEFIVEKLQNNRKHFLNG